LECSFSSIDIEFSRVLQAEQEMANKRGPRGTSYQAKIPDSNGFIHYTDEENSVWHDLITRQIPMLPGRACDQWINAMELMQFPHDRIPQLNEVSEVLKDHTGWSVAPVPALIGFTEFFHSFALAKSLTTCGNQTFSTRFSAIHHP
jgi:phenylalanine-4-hydroxylase